MNASITNHPLPVDASTLPPAECTQACDAWGYCVWCEAPSTTHDRACTAPDGDGHLFQRAEPA